MTGLRAFAPTVLVAALGTTFGSALVIAPGVVTQAMAAAGDPAIWERMVLAAIAARLAPAATATSPIAVYQRIDPAVSVPRASVPRASAFTPG